MSPLHVADTGLFVAMGQPSNPRYRAVRSFARRNDITFTLPEQVYDELAVGEDPEVTPPVDVAIGEGWVDVVQSVDYTNPFVSRTMDGVRRFIANADGRSEDEIERADTALAGVAAQALAVNATSHVNVYTTDIVAGEAVEAVFGREGYGDAITFVNAFGFIEALIE